MNHTTFLSVGLRPTISNHPKSCQTIKVGVEDVLQKLQSIARQIQQANWKPEQVIGITKGGAVPATMVSHLLGQPETLYLSPRQLQAHLAENPQKRMLVIDDICDSGQTFADITPFLSSSHRLAALIENTEQQVRLNFSGAKIRRSVQPAWYEFFWEPSPLKDVPSTTERESYPAARELSLTLQMLGSLSDLREWFLRLCHEPSLVRRQSIFDRAKEVRVNFGEASAQAILLLANTRMFEAVRGQLMRLEQQP